MRKLSSRFSLAWRPHQPRGKDSAVTTSIETLLPEEMLKRFRSRAAGYDERNEFFTEDLEELKNAGYLRMLVPEEFGGHGLSLKEATRAQRRLAGAAPATALGINMHQVIVALAYTLWLRGRSELNWVFDAAVDGEIFAFGISEAGNDAVLFDSVTTAEKVYGGGYRLTGTKIFTSLSPVWSKLLVHARTPDDQLAFGFIDRQDEGVEIRNDWDTLGMRATQSCTTHLNEVFLPEKKIGTHAPLGPNMNPLVFGIFGPFELLLASVYTGIGERAVELASEIVAQRMSRAKQQPYAQDPDIRFQIAEAGILTDGSVLQLDKLADDVDHLFEVDHGTKWLLHFSGVKHRCVEAAKEAVEIALRTTGGAQYFRSSELQRLYRDVIAGIYHPSDSESVHASYAKALLGPID
ncbi:acyl-CoA dehydrogenase [Corynebacterium yudongzhengii]|uniref:Acyl-CoA dehydrogenase n=1 Tax=Corynebacterium yudongzhengii TaxID=2080740 RepID=A0A2U1T8U7_9CORY|nr:acyl-CoA dehydrogenase [Corynebacterium yudongzhengii]PWC02431.1 acyl-CoA dehydrogenase [Corynebacterium yudongzhengii]